MAVRFGGKGVDLPKNQLGANEFWLRAGSVMLIPPGTWNCWTDGVANLQQKSPISGLLLPVGGPPITGLATQMVQIDSDGTNFCFCNSTNHPVGAVLSNHGSGYTSAPTVTPSEGDSTWRAIVGGAVSTVATTVTGGSGYTYIPNLIVAPPPPGGVSAVFACTISGGVVNSVTVVAQGAGYTSPPAVTVLNDPRDTTGSGAQITLSLTGAGTVTSVLPVDFGATAITSGTVPTLAFAGGGGTSAAATAIMDWVVTSITVGNGGGGFGGPLAVAQVFGSGVSVAPAYTNPFTQLLMYRSRTGLYSLPVSTGAVVGAGQVAIQYARVGGVNTAALHAVLDASIGPTTQATLTLSVGGLGSFVYLQTATG